MFLAWIENQLQKSKVFTALEFENQRGKIFAASYGK